MSANPNSFDLSGTDASCTSAIINQGVAYFSNIHRLPLPRLSYFRAAVIAVEAALEKIQPELPSSDAASKQTQLAVFALEIESFSCCLRGQEANFAAVKQFVATLSVTGDGIDPWTGYSTILSILDNILLKVCIAFIRINFTWPFICTRISAPFAIL